MLAGMRLHETRADVFDRLVLNAPKLRARLEEAVLSISLERAIDSAMKLQMEVADEDRELLQSKLFAQRTWMNFDGLALEYTGLRKTRDTLSLTFESSPVARLRRRKGPRRAAAETTTRVRFARQLVSEIEALSFRGDPDGERIHEALVRKRRENSWDCLRRLADDRQWRMFEDRLTIFFGSDEWLLSLGKPFVISERDEGINFIDFDHDGRKRAASATVECFANQWAARPGAPVDIKGLGALARRGLWLVERIDRRDIFSDLCTVSLIRKQPELPEPKPEVSHDDRGAGGSVVGSGKAPGPVSSAGFQWPIRGPITSPFGDNRGHAGIDIDGQTGDAIRASRPGVVTFAGTASGYGLVVYITHAGGFETRYAHLSSFGVVAGQQVGYTTVVGRMGATGNATGSHLHFECRRGGVAIDPMSVLP